MKNNLEKKYIKFLYKELEELKVSYYSYAKEYYEDGYTATSFPVECLREEFWGKCAQVLEKAEDRGVDIKILKQFDDFCWSWN